MLRLPERYYLTHFEEFLDYIREPCAQLLDDEHHRFLNTFAELSLDSQCALVRIANRKSCFIAHSSMFYEEIDQPLEQLDRLHGCELLSNLATSHCSAFTEVLTRPQLTRLLRCVDRHRGISSLKKPELLALTRHVVPEQTIIEAFSQDYSVRTFDDTIQYFLFLFFGNLRGALNQFSMRDLGVMKTRQDAGAQVARFDNLSQAQSAFFYACRLRDINADGNGETFLADVHNPREAIGAQAMRYKDRYFHALGKALLKQRRESGLQALAISAEPAATEKWLRERYADGAKEEVEEHLIRIIEEPESESLLAFAEDFLARKYQKKRTSELTDWLRNESQRLSIDERYRNMVERGVIDHYASTGRLALHTENSPWRALFGLMFWDELYVRDEAALSNEFDRRPRLIASNQFYSAMQPFIDNKLAEITNLSALMQLISHTAAKQFGQITPLFFWHAGLLEQIKQFLSVLPLEAVKKQLRSMCQDFASFSDGYPDLLVIENGKGHFEEIKAVGDQLRRNQLITLKSLRRHGFDVRITQVEWCINPDQPYAVVDIETTGGRAAHHNVTEIGVAKLVNGEVVDQWQTLVNPQRHIPASITRLTGIDNNMVVDAPVFADIADELRQVFEGCIFVAHNVNFDYGFIKQEYARLEQHFSMPKLCTVREMRKAVPGLASYSLANLTSHFDIDMQRHHRAMSDARAAAELLNIINAHRTKNEQ